MTHGIPQNRADIASLAKSAQGIAKEMLEVWDGLGHSGRKTLCVIKFGPPRQRRMQFVGMFPGDSCEQIDHLRARELAPKQDLRGQDWVLTVLNNND